MYKRALLTICLTVGVVVVTTAPLLLQAQSIFDPGTIVPQCTGDPLIQGGTERECTFCDFMQLVRNILNFILFLTMVTAGALFAWAGWLFATSGGSGANHQKAKNIFKNVIIGLVLVLGAYTIVNTLMKMLVANDFSLGNFTTSWSTLCPGSTGARSSGGDGGGFR
jgi:hypothetical protein